MIIRPVSCNFHQLFRNDPQDITLRKVSFSTSHLVMTLQVPFCKQYQQASYFHQSFRNKRKTRHHQAADFHRFFRIALFFSYKKVLPLVRSVSKLFCSPYALVGSFRYYDMPIRLFVNCFSQIKDRSSERPGAGGN